METYIFSIPEIEYMIFDYLNPKEKSVMIFVSKYYYETVSTFPLYVEMKLFHKTKETCGLDNDARSGGRNYTHTSLWNSHIDIINKFIIACKNNYLLVAKYLFGFLYKPHISHIRDRIFAKVCGNGHFKMMKWLENIECGTKNFYADANKVYKDGFVESCENGELEIVQYLHSKRENLPHKEKFPFAHITGGCAFNLSCQNGHLEVVKYLCSFDRTRDQDNFFLLRLGNEFEKSSANGHIEVVKFLVSVYDKYGVPYHIHRNNEGAFRKSCKYGHVDVVKYLISLDNTINISAQGHYALRKSCENGHVEVVKYLLQVSSLYATDTFFETQINSCFLMSCRNGHLEIIKYMLSLKDHFNINDAFIMACSNNHLQLAKYFISKTKLYNKICIKNSELLIDCCQNGHLDIVKFLYELNELPNPKISFRSRKNDIFDIACKNGHLKIAKWINQLAIQTGERISSRDFIKYINNDNPYNQHKVAKFIYSLNQKLPPNKKMDYAFRLSCKNGNLKIAKWIYNTCLKNNFKININKNNYSLFKESCLHGKAEIAEWLYSLDSSIKEVVVLEGSPLYRCRSNGWVEMAKLLVKIWPDRYYVHIYGDTIIDWNYLWLLK